MENYIDISKEKSQIFAIDTYKQKSKVTLHITELLGSFFLTTNCLLSYNSTSEINHFLSRSKDGPKTKIILDQKRPSFGTEIIITAYGFEPTNCMKIRPYFRIRKKSISMASSTRKSNTERTRIQQMQTWEFQDKVKFIMEKRED